MLLEYNKHKVFVKQLIQGDEKAFADLIGQYHQLLCAFAYSLTKDRGRSEDIVQNVFLKVWDRRSQLKADHSIKSYLHKLTYNEFIDHTRKQKSISSLEKEYMAALNTFMEQKDWEEMGKIFDMVKAEINKLPPQCKKVFALSKQEGLTNAEIAEYLHISTKAVEAQITKGFSILRMNLKEKSDLLLFLLFQNNSSNQ